MLSLYDNTIGEMYPSHKYNYLFIFKAEKLMETAIPASKDEA